MENTSPQTPAARRRVLLLLTLAVILYFFANFQRTVVPGSIFSELQHDLNASAAAVTALGSVFMYVYAVSQLFAGVLADKFGGYRLIVAGGALFCAGSVLFPFAQSLSLLYVSRFVVGVGASAIYLSMVKEFQRAFPKNFAPALGVAMLVGYAGSIVATAPFVALLRCVSWREGLIGFGAVAALVWFVFLLSRLSVRLPQPAAEVKFSFTAFAPVVKKRHNWFMFIVSDCAFAVFYVLQTVIGKKFLEDYCGMTMHAAGWILAVTGTLSAVANFGMPLVSKLFRDRRRPFMLLMGGGTFAGAAGILLALLCGVHDPVLISALLFLPAVCANMTPVYLALLSETNPPEQLGVCASFANFIAYMLVAVLGTLTGVLMDLFVPEIVAGVRVYPVSSYMAVFGMLTIFGVMAFGSAFFLRESRGMPIQVK